VLDLAAGCGQRIARAGMDAVCRFCEQRAPACGRTGRCGAGATAGVVDVRLARRLDAGSLGHFPHLPPRTVAAARNGGGCRLPVPPAEVPVPRGRPAPAATASGAGPCLCLGRLTVPRPKGLGQRDTRPVPEGTASHPGATQQTEIPGQTARLPSVILPALPPPCYQGAAGAHGSPGESDAAQ
jgi:hypothetical protein